LGRPIVSFRRLSPPPRIADPGSSSRTRATTIASRLTHTVEAAQITRSGGARALGLNSEGLAEAVALSHGPRHTPFGLAPAKRRWGAQAEEPHGGFVTHNGAEPAHWSIGIEVSLSEFPPRGLNSQASRCGEAASSRHSEIQVALLRRRGGGAVSSIRLVSLCAGSADRGRSSTIEISPILAHDVDDGLKGDMLTVDDSPTALPPVLARRPLPSPAQRGEPAAGKPGLRALRRLVIRNYDATYGLVTVPRRQRRRGSERVRHPCTSTRARRIVGARKLRPGDPRRWRRAQAV